MNSQGDCPSEPLVGSLRFQVPIGFMNHGLEDREDHWSHLVGLTFRYHSKF